MQLEIYALSAGCSLLTSPGECLGLEPKWHCHFGIPRQRTQLYYVSILMMGCPWGFAGVDILRTSTCFRFTVKVLRSYTLWFFERSKDKQGQGAVTEVCEEEGRVEVGEPEKGQPGEALRFDRVFKCRGAADEQDCED